MILPGVFHEATKQDIALTPGCEAGWINCEGIKSRILVLRRHPPATKVRANGKSPFKWTEDNPLVTINPPCLPQVARGADLDIIKSSFLSHPGSKNRSHRPINSQPLHSYCPPDRRNPELPY